MKLEPPPRSIAAPFAPTDHDQLHLRWLQRIRWVALLFYAAVFIGTSAALGITLSRFTIAAVLVVGALSNLPLWRGQIAHRVGVATLAGSALVVDVLLLTALLYACGGYTNPFSMMYLVYVTLAAFFLTPRWTWGIFGVATCAFIALFFFHVPVPELSTHAHHHASHSLEQPAGFSLHLHGMLLAFIIIGVILAYFLTRLRSELDLLRGKEQNHYRLMSLATVTAGAAHELATPIGTLTFLEERLRAHLGDDPRWSEDLTTMREELERCSTILRSMRGKGGELPGELPSRLRVDELVETLRATLPCSADISFALELPAHSTLITLKDSMITSLHALIVNALHSYDGMRHLPSPRVSVTVANHLPNITFLIEDHGSGMSDETLRKLGDPFFTLKPPGQGLGLGIFLVKLFAHQVKGELRIESAVGRGTRVALSIPQEVIA